VVLTEDIAKPRQIKITSESSQREFTKTLSDLTLILRNTEFEIGIIVDGNHQYQELVIHRLTIITKQMSFLLGLVN
jgi:hypothetical protein